ncbi:MAG: polysaccharide deacetylase family protein, partial [Bacteroidota bacterium]
GLHPSFGSNADPARLKLELERLSGVLHLEVRKSRQHFLKLSLPSTYRNLLDLGITDDYTMGYAAAFGFRASTSLPFYFYDLDQERETTLKVHPFCVMEATFKYYLRVPPEEALDHIRPMVQAVRDVNGSLMCVWHNDSLSNHRIWQGWQGLYEAMVQLSVP